ncbi:MAG: YHYH protein [Proteobacteria bacterium]|nr:YHYH protein [Pseudomonadota bacterium]MDA1285858.1 YHYH protein [Pseudomonadota bacterium]
MHLSNGDLDECHGHAENVNRDGKAAKIYHYHLTDEYPFTLGCYKGTPVKPC